MLGFRDQNAESVDIWAQQTNLQHKLQIRLPMLGPLSVKLPHHRTQMARKQKRIRPPHHDEEGPRARLEELEAPRVALHGENAVRRRGDAADGAALAHIGYLEVIACGMCVGPETAR